MCGIFLCTCGRHKDYDTIKHRGPDGSVMLSLRYEKIPVVMVFHHLSIHAKNPGSAIQPIMKNGAFLLANAEIYNHKTIRETILAGRQCISESDCEVLLDLYLADVHDYFLDGEYAYIIYDSIKGKLFIGRDKYGVRPLFISGSCVSSEAKALPGSMPFPPGCIMEIDLQTKATTCRNLQPRIPMTVNEPVNVTLRRLLTQSVEKRLMGSANIGCFLSGGLDSSLVVAIAAQIMPDIRTFTIGLKDSSDVIAAKYLTKQLGISKNHTVIEFTPQQGIEALNDVIYTLETYDVTTIRASVPQYLLSQYIASTGIKVLLSGEGSDELFAGYQYFKNAPDSNELAKESDRLLSELYMFDNLRTDRVTSAWGLEVRVPFLDLELVDFVRNADPALRNTPTLEKQWLRDACDGLLPKKILLRSKEAFSDAVSGATVSWKQALHDYANTMPELPDELGPTQEAKYYRYIYNQFYDRELITHYWMPKWIKQKSWDPSATTIDCYKRDQNF